MESDRQGLDCCLLQILRSALTARLCLGLVVLGFLKSRRQRAPLAGGHCTHPRTRAVAGNGRRVAAASCQPPTATAHPLMRLFIPRQPLNHIAPLPRSLWDSEVVGWVFRCAWLNQNNVFVGMMRAQCIEHAPSDDASFLNLCFSRSGHGYAPVGRRTGGSTTSLSATSARRFVVLFSADDNRQFLPFAP